MSLARHFITLFSGRLVAQLILVVSTPLLTRLFSPEDFGLVSLVSSITQIPIILLMGRLDQAIPQSRDDQEAGRLVSLCLCWTVVMTSLCFFLAFISGDWLAGHYKQPQLKWLLLASVVLFIPVALAQIGKQWAAYRERHGVTASADVLLTIGRRVAPMPLPFLGGGGPWALFSGLALGVCLSAMTFVSRLGSDIIQSLQFNWLDLKNTLIEYRRFPLFLSSASLLDIAAWSSLSIMIGAYFGVEAIGWFGQAHALLFLPISLLSQSASNVFYPRLAQARENPDQLGDLLTRMVNLSFDLCWYPLLVLLPLAPSLWGSLLGEAFSTSGLLAQTLIPMGIANVIFSPVSVAINVFHEQRALFWQSLSLNLTRVGGLYLGCLYGDLRVALFAYAIITTLFRITQLAWLLKLGGVNLRSVIKGVGPKVCYSVFIMIIVGCILKESSLSPMLPSLQMLIISIVVATLGLIFWGMMVIHYNDDAHILMNRMLNKLKKS